MKKETHNQSIKLIVEILGTFCIVFFGTGAIILNEQYGFLLNFGVSLTFGASVATSIIFFAKYSGAHFNPAVTLAMWYSGKIKIQTVLLFIVSQLCGAILASTILKMIFPQSENLGTTQPNGSYLQSWMLEYFMTLLLIVIILYLDYRNLKNYYLVGGIIGVAIFVAAYWGGPISGASLNPARSLGPAIISNHFNYLFLYLLAPTLGALTAVYLCKKTSSNCCKNSCC